MTHALVTGASGFIGHHLVRELVERGHEVTCLVRHASNTTALRELDVRLVRGDVTDPCSLRSAVEDVDHVYHLAGRTKALCYRDYHQVNCEGIRHLLEACAQRVTPPDVVLVSSLAAVGPSRRRDLPVLETIEPSPVSDYGRSKRAGELVAEQFADKMAITIVRPPIVFGQYDQASLPLFRSINAMGVHLVIGRGRQSHSLIHATDLAQLIISAGAIGTRLSGPRARDESTAASGYYHAACDETITYAELGHRIARGLGRRGALIVPTPPRTVWVVAAANTVLAHLTGRPRFLVIDKAREARGGHWICTAERARDHLMFAPRKTLDERLEETAEWYRHAGWLLGSAR